MAPESYPPAKLCPRCGAFYLDLKSQTCPQCFARLEILDNASARQLSEEQAARVGSLPDAEAKAEQDERYKEQSFGACLAVMGVLLVTCVAAIIFIWIAASRHHANPTSYRPAAAISAPTSPDALLPRSLIGLSRHDLRTAALLPGTSTPLYEAIYQGGVQVYALPAAGLTVSQKNSLHLAAELAAEQHNPPLIEQEITTARAQYAILGRSQAVVAQVADSLVGSMPNEQDR